jgi:hypothetical protein
VNPIGYLDPGSVRVRPGPTRPASRPVTLMNWEAIEAEAEESTTGVSGPEVRPPSWRPRSQLVAHRVLIDRYFFISKTQPPFRVGARRRRPVPRDAFLARRAEA